MAASYQSMTATESGVIGLFAGHQAGWFSDHHD